LPDRSGNQIGDGFRVVKYGIHNAGVQIAAWNDWREKNPKLLELDLRGADLTGSDLPKAELSGVDLRGASLFAANLPEANLGAADLRGANLSEAFLTWANLSGADLRGTNLVGANLSEAFLFRADLREADLFRANLVGANLAEANLCGTNLSEAFLRGAQLIETDLRNATLTGSSVHGVSVWNIKVDDHTKQQNLVITDPDEPVITVDNIEVAQFIYLFLNNQTIRKVIDTITSKAVLILGRFSEDRKPLLDAIRDELRKHNYLPILFDFQPSPNQATLETVKTLAGMARYVIADLTDARSVLMELAAIVPAFPSVAVRLLLKKSAPEYGMPDYVRLYRSVV
jgi:uncharacterized protein YjbI with pentapeptide repeats